MKKYIIALFLMPLFASAQVAQVGVGIGNEAPSRELDVTGTITSKSTIDRWFFEDLGVFTLTPKESYLVVLDKDVDQLKVFDPEHMSYASINYATYRFNKLTLSGLEYYDTKIDADKYHVMIGGFIVYGGNLTSPTVSGTSTTISSNVLYSSRAYINPTTNTWILKFQPNNGATFSGVARVDIVLNVAIYRKNLLLMDTNDEIVIDMTNTSIGTAPKPAGI